MIIVDGDSVAQAVRHYVYPHEAWYQYIAKRHGVDVECWARPATTARDCYLRLWKLWKRIKDKHATKPKWYFLMVGQWSQNHEPMDEFHDFLDRTVRAVVIEGMEVCLITPVKQMQYLGETDTYAEVIRECARSYDTELVDLFERMNLLKIETKEDIEEWFEIEDVTCHLNKNGNRLMAELFDERIGA